MKKPDDKEVEIKITIPDGASDFFPGTNEPAAAWEVAHGGAWWPEFGPADREAIKGIVGRAFLKPIAFEEVIEDIRRILACPEGRAKLIAETETGQAMVGAQFEMWKKSGVVRKIKWLANGVRCPPCCSNDRVVRELGEVFPSGHILPLVHPGCRCILTAVEFYE